jgi:hypothetical protein
MRSASLTLPLPQLDPARARRPRAQVMLPEGPGTYSIRDLAAAGKLAQKVVANYGMTDLGITMYAPRGHAEYNMRSFEARPRPRAAPFRAARLSSSGAALSHGRQASWIPCVCAARGVAIARRLGSATASSRRSGAPGPVTGRCEGRTGVARGPSSGRRPRVTG